jgi:biotin-dependent carboxylase-like uncharacterized protein
MDLPSLRAANVLVGNPPEAAALEFGHIGGTWEVAGAAIRVAVAGGSFRVQADGADLAPWRSHTLPPGGRLSIESAVDAVWGYLAVAGGFAVAPQLGSSATHLRSGIGGLRGRRIIIDDILPLRPVETLHGLERRIMPLARGNGPFRVVLGPQDDYFAPETVAAFLAASWRLSHRRDRMGTWLDGPKIPHTDGFNVVSDGLIPGCIQVPGAGQPVVLMMDCQTIGGYPKLATIVTADLPRFAQSRAGSPVSFVSVEVEEAQLLHRAYRAMVDGLSSAATAIPERPFWLRY